MGVYVRWVGTLLNGVVYSTNTYDNKYRQEQVMLLFRFMEEERVWLLMRRMGFKQGIQIDAAIVDDLIEQFHAVTYEHATGIYWNPGQFRTELERCAEDLSRYDRIDAYTHSPVV